MMMPTAVAVPLTAPALSFGGLGMATLLGLVAVTLVFGVLIARLAADHPTGAPRDTFTPDASPRRRPLALLREAA